MNKKFAYMIVDGFAQVAEIPAIEKIIIEAHGTANEDGEIKTEYTQNIEYEYHIPEGFIEYTPGSEPKELLDALLPTPDQIIQELDSGIQKHLDNFAKTRRYANVDSMAKYVGCSTPKFAAEAEYMRDAVADTWAKSYEIMDDVLGGKRPVPTLEELLRELPKLEWPVW